MAVGLPTPGVLKPGVDLTRTGFDMTIGASRLPVPIHQLILSSCLFPQDSPTNCSKSKWGWLAYTWSAHTMCPQQVLRWQLGRLISLFHLCTTTMFLLVCQNFTWSPHNHMSMLSFFSHSNQASTRSSVNIYIWVIMSRVPELLRSWANLHLGYATCAQTITGSQWTTCLCRL